MENFADLEIQYNQPNINDMKYKHAMEILSAASEGKPLQWSDDGEVWCDNPHLGSVEADQLNDPDTIRIKPTPSKVPFGPADIKAGMWFRLRSWAPNCMRLVDAVYNHGIHLGDDINATITWDTLMKDYSYSVDAITWHPCEKAEKPSQPPPKPRRVWVNYYAGAEQVGVMHLSKEGAEAEATDEACESAVEFVEVIR